MTTLPPSQYSRRNDEAICRRSLTAPRHTVRNCIKTRDRPVLPTQIDKESYRPLHTNASSDPPTLTTRLLLSMWQLTNPPCLVKPETDDSSRARYISSSNNMNVDSPRYPHLRRRHRLTTSEWIRPVTITICHRRPQARPSQT